MRLAFLLIAFVAVPLAVAEEVAPPDDTLAFKGLQLGVASRDDVLKQWPLAECFGKDGNDTCMLIATIAAGKLRKNDQYRSLDTEAYTNLLRQMSVGGAGNSAITFNLYGGKLGRIYMTPKASSFDKLATALTDRYGKPVVDRSFPVSTKAGATFENRRMQWKLPGGEIWIQRYGANVNDSSVTYISDERIAQSVKDAEKGRQDAAKDL